MTLSLAKAIVNDGGALYYSNGYHLMIETHLNWLKFHPKTYSISIDPGDAYKYIGDFFGLLTLQRVPTQHHWTVMRMNGLRASTDYNNDMLTILIPDAGVINSLAQVFSTTNTTLA